MYEKGLKRKSKWQPYITFMPLDTSHLPMFWEVNDEGFMSDDEE